VSVACLALSAATGDRPVNRGGHQVVNTATFPTVERPVSMWTWSIDVTGAVLKIARACVCGRPTLVRELCRRPRGMLEAASSAASDSASFERVPSHC